MAPAPALLLPAFLNYEVRLKIVKALHKADTGAMMSMAEKLKGPARTNSRKASELIAHLAQCGGTDESVLRQLVRAWFRQRNVLRDHMRGALVAAGYAVGEPDFSQPLDLAAAGAVPAFPAALRLNGEPTDQNILMAWLLGWPYTIANALGATDAPAITASLPPLNPTPAHSEPPQPETVALNATAEFTPAPALELAVLEADLEALDQQFAAAAQALTAAATTLQTGHLPAAGALPNLAVLAARWQQQQMVLGAWAAQLGQSPPDLTAGLGAARTIAHELTKLAQAQAAANSEIAHARAILDDLSRLRHRDNADFEPLYAIKAQTAALLDQLGADHPNAAALAADLRASTHPLARLRVAVAAYDQLRSAGSQAFAAAAPAVDLLPPPDGLALYTAWAAGWLELASAMPDAEAALEATAKGISTVASVIADAAVTTEAGAAASSADKVGVSTVVADNAVTDIGMALSAVVAIDTDVIDTEADTTAAAIASEACIPTVYPKLDGTSTAAAVPENAASSIPPVSAQADASGPATAPAPESDTAPLIAVPNPTLTKNPETAPPLIPPLTAQPPAAPAAFVQPEPVEFSTNLQLDAWALLERQEGALVYQLAINQEAQAAAAMLGLTPFALPPAWLLRALLLAPSLHSAHGPLAALLRDDAPRYAPADLDADPVSGGADGRRLLAVAVALRVALVLPEFRDNHWLAEAGRVGPPAFGAFCRLVAERQNPAPLSSELLRQTQTRQAWQQQADNLKRELYQWGEDQRQSRFYGRQSHPIVRLWLKLLEPGQLVNRLLRGLEFSETAIAVDLPGGLATLAQILDLHPAATQPLNLTSADLATIRSNKDARLWLEGRVIELQQWYQQHQELADTRPNGGSPGDYFAQSDRSLVVNLLATHAEALAEVEREHLAANQRPRRVGLAACAAALHALYEWLQPQLGKSFAPIPPEPAARWLLALPLLQVPDLDLTADWEPDQPADPALGNYLRTLAAAAPLAWAAVYARAAAAPPDHRATARLLALAEAGRADLGRPLADLWAERDTDLGQQRRLLSQALDRAAAAAERGRRYGYLNPDLHQDLSVELADLRPATTASALSGADAVGDFRQRHRKLAEWHQRLDVARAQTTAAKRQEVSHALEALPTPPAAADLTRLDQALSEGWLTLIDDYLPDLASGRTLNRSEAPDAPPLALTLPSALQALEDHENRLNPTAIAVALRERQWLPADSAATTEQADRAANAYTQWSTLRPANGRLRDAAALRELAAILEFVGFAGAEVEARSPNVSYTLPRGFKGEHADLQALPLRDRTQCPVSYFGSGAKGRYRLLCLGEMPAKEDLVRLVLQHHDLVTHTRPVLVVLLAPLPWARRAELATYCRQERATFLLLDELLLLYLATQGLGQSALPLFFRLTLPFTYLKPYGASGPVSPEMFYGRQDEYRRLVQFRGPDSAFVVYGGRQLGKTALLRQVERDAHRPQRQRYVLFIDIAQLGRPYADPRGLAGLLLDHLREAGIELPAPAGRTAGLPDLTAVLTRIGDWLRGDASRRLLVLLDEADQFMERDAARDFPEIMALRRALDQQEHLKIVFSGLHNVQKTLRQPNHPLEQLKKAVCIGPLDFKQGARLIRTPLESLGFYFGKLQADGTFRPDDHLVDQIIVETNYYPSLIQIFCDKLLDELYALPHRPGQPLPFAISEDVVQRASAKARNDISNKFALTLELDLRYSLLANLVADLTRPAAKSRGVTPTEVQEDASMYWGAGFAGRAESYVLALLEEMVGLGILERLESADYGPRFRLRTANVRTLLGTDDAIEAKLNQFDSEPPPAEYLPSIARLAYSAPGRGKAKTKRLRSPFTAEELGRIETYTGLTLVRGTDAAGRGQIAGFMQARYSSGLQETDAAALLETLDKLQKAPAWPRLLLVNGPLNAKLLRETAERLARLRKRPTAAARGPLPVVALLAPAELHDFWAAAPAQPDPFAALRNAGVQVLDLQLWDKEAVREWLQEEEFALGQHAAVMLATGGWHGPLVDFFAAEIQQPDPQRHLAQFRNTLGQPAARANWGLTDAPAFFRTLAELDEPFTLADAEVYNEGELTPAAVAAYLHWAEALRLLIRTPTGNYRVDATVGRLFQPAEQA